MRAMTAMGSSTSCRQVMRTTLNPPALRSASRLRSRSNAFREELKAVAVDLDHQSAVAPKEIDDVTTYLHIYGGAGQAGLPDQCEEALLGFGPCEGGFFAAPQEIAQPAGASVALRALNHSNQGSVGCHPLRQGLVEGAFQVTRGRHFGEV